MNIEINLLKLASQLADREVIGWLCMRELIEEDEARHRIFEVNNEIECVRHSYYDMWLNFYNDWQDKLVEMSIKKEEPIAEPTTDESEDQATLDISPKLQDAIDKLTIENFDSLDYGDEIELNDEYTIYHYSEEDIVVINRIKDDEGNDDWTEVLQVMSDGINFTFEKL